ncbi:MAG: hypothetical protein HYX57_01745 [Chloroflexi bacterium]|nr:hypothetical protein [Chloroflexota bacterium]
MDAAELELRNATYGLFVELGRAPSAGEMAARAGTTEAAVRAGWDRLHAAHALVLDAAGEIAMANPFAARPTPFRVEAAGRSWFGNCGWDAFGIGSALHVDSVIRTTCADCGEPITIEVVDGRPIPAANGSPEPVWHVLVPAAEWWADIGYT